MFHEEDIVPHMKGESEHIVIYWLLKNGTVQNYGGKQFITHNNGVLQRSV